MKFRKPSARKLKHFTGIAFSMDKKSILYNFALSFFKAMSGLFANTKAIRWAYFNSVPANTFLTVKTDNASFVVNSSDKIVAGYTYVYRKAFEYKDVILAAKLLPENHERELLIDIGANIGTVCVYGVSNGLFKSALAFEPEPNNFKLLQSNIALNNLSGKIDAQNLALSDVEEGVLEFEICDFNHGNHQVIVASNDQVLKKNNQELIEVPCTKLDLFVDKISREKALVWIDVQGHEGHVLAGASKIIQKRVPICMEFDPFNLKKIDVYQLLLDELKKSSYEVIIDLKYPDKIMEFSITTLDDLTKELGTTGVRNLLFY